MTKYDLTDFALVLRDVVYSTKDTVNMLKSRATKEEINSYTAEILKEKEKLINKYGNIKLPQEELIRHELREHMSNIISLINEKYKDYIPEDRLEILNKMYKSNGSIKIINDVNYDHDFSVDIDEEALILNMAKIGVSSDTLEPDKYDKMVAAKGALAHEIFHIIIRMLKPKLAANERMHINLSNGDSIKSLGMVGFILNEGFVEKYASEFCQECNLYYQPAVSYVPFVNVCNFITEKYTSIDISTVFSLEAQDILSAISGEDKKLYNDAECVSFVARYKEKNKEDVISSSIEEFKLDYSDMTIEEASKLYDYYDCKKNKLDKYLTEPITPKYNFKK